MIAKQSVYLTGDRSKAVPEGDSDARFLLIREGHEVNEAELEKHDGAIDLVTKESKVKAEPRPPIPAPNFKKFGKEAEETAKPAVPGPTKPPKTGARATGHPKSRAKKSAK